MKITLVNHACCKVETSAGALLCDPWIEGPAFNLGWDLLIPTPLEFDAIMAGVRWLWLSHEHPDHFSVPFLNRIAGTQRGAVTILFQRTRDQRVTRFCRSLGLEVRELEDGRATSLTGSVSVLCRSFDLYDSWLALSDGGETILNMNDCPMAERHDLARVRRLVPSPAVLLSQFGYAAWKGGRDNRDYRLLAGRQKLEILAAQIRALRPRAVIPFASLIYFSNMENSYMNDALNTPEDAARAIAAAGAEPVILYPGDAWNVVGRWNNGEALERYRERYAALPSLPLRGPGPSCSLDELNAAFREYVERIFAKNSRWLIWIASRLPALRAFQPVVVDLPDIDTALSVSLFDGLAPHDVTARPADVSMHSSSLLFLFKNEFGFDTLTVNGRLEANSDGFARMSRCFGIGSLNAMGLSVSPRLLLRPRVVVMRLRRLRHVVAELARRDRAGTIR